MANHDSAGNRAIKRKAKLEAELKVAKELKPGDLGWILRARVPKLGYERVCEEARVAISC